MSFLSLSLWEDSLSLEGLLFDGTIFSDKKGWTLYVIDQPVVNAFVLSSRDVFCYTGLLALTEGDEDLLAAVMGHEIEQSGVLSSLSPFCLVWVELTTQSLGSQSARATYRRIVGVHGAQVSLFLSLDPGTNGKEKRRRVP